MISAATRGRREEYAQATRDALIASGRAAFFAEGFRGTSIEAVSRAARVTRGAFYHHFADKAALFDAVVVEMQRETSARIRAAGSSCPQPWDRMTTGMEAFLDVCLEPIYAKIVVTEAPAVLGPVRFREIEEEHPLALLRASLHSLHRRGELQCPDPDLLADLVDAMLCRLASALPRSREPPALRAAGFGMIRAFLAGHRRAGGRIRADEKRDRGAP